MPKKVRADPLTGCVDCIPVSGYFHEAHNLIGCVSVNPNEPIATFHKIGKDNGTAKAFVEFIQDMIVSKFLHHGEALIMDNAAIHTGGEASCAEKPLWETVVNDKPLNILALCPPTCSPELNPIELVFHILSMHLRDWRNHGSMQGVAVTHKTKEVFDSISCDIVLKCTIHCGC